VRDRLYRLIYGGRGALEEVMLQAPAKSFPALVKCDEEPSATPSYPLAGGVLHSGDILVSRGGAPSSALIARGNDYPGNFSHVALVHVDRETGVPSIIEAHIERGVVVSTLDEYLRDVKLRIMQLRLKADLPQMMADPELPHQAAQKAVDEARARHIPYDFAMDFEDPSTRFCSEVVSHAYRQVGVDLWQGTSTISSPGVARWLADFGVRRFETQAPADLEYDPKLMVVTEWRDPDTLWEDHVDNAVIEVMLEGAERGERLTYPWYLLPPGRVVKAYSAVLNLFGHVGPVPEGMSAAGGLRELRLSKVHKAIKKKVLSLASDFRTQNGYTPPYWELLRLARQTRKD